MLRSKNKADGERLCKGCNEIQVEYKKGAEEICQIGEGGRSGSGQSKKE